MATQSGVVRTVLCLLMVAESTHFDRLTKFAIEVEREALTFIRSEQMEVQLLWWWHGIFMS